MNKIEFKIEIITPMFIGGADGKTEELRPPSIKGLMRFWWRAMNGNLSIRDMLEKETNIFGGGGERANKSSFSIKIADARVNSGEIPKKHRISITGKTFQMDILAYLAYGLFDKGKYIRKYFGPKSSFTIIFIIKKEDYLEEILKSFYFMTAFGGLGSRSRNGFGSFDVLNRQVFNYIGEKYVDNIVPTKEILEPFMKSNDIPSYSAFSKGMKLFKTKKVFDTWDKALAEIGIIYKNSREKLEGKHKYQKRQYIGAPLDPAKENFKSLLERHSKPYFMKVVKDGQKYVGYILYLPSKYCEGLDYNRNNEEINHSIVNSNFESVCKEFNNLLEFGLEVIL